MPSLVSISRQLTLESHSRKLPKGTVGELATWFQFWLKKLGGSAAPVVGKGLGVGDGVGEGAAGAAIIFTVAEANLVGSALLLAVIVAVPVVDGAV